MTENKQSACSNGIRKIKSSKHPPIKNTRTVCIILTSPWVSRWRFPSVGFLFLTSFRIRFVSLQSSSDRVSCGVDDRDLLWPRTSVFLSCRKSSISPGKHWNFSWKSASTAPCSWREKRREGLIQMYHEYLPVFYSDELLLHYIRRIRETYRRWLRFSSTKTQAFVSRWDRWVEHLEKATSCCQPLPPTVKWLKHGCQRARYITETPGVDVSADPVSV